MQPAGVPPSAIYSGVGDDEFGRPRVWLRRESDDDLDRLESRRDASRGGNPVRQRHARRARLIPRVA